MACGVFPLYRLDALVHLSMLLTCNCNSLWPFASKYFAYPITRNYFNKLLHCVIDPKLPRIHLRSIQANWAFMGHGGEACSQARCCTYKNQEAVGSYQDGITQPLFRGLLDHLSYQSHSESLPFTRLEWVWYNNKYISRLMTYQCRYPHTQVYMCIYSSLLIWLSMIYMKKDI